MDNVDHAAILQNGDVTSEDLEITYLMFKKLLDLTTDGFIAIDKNDFIIEINNSYCKKLGITRDEALKKKIYDIIPETKLPQTRDNKIDDYDVLHWHTSGILKKQLLICSRSHITHKNGNTIALSHVRFPNRTKEVVENIDKFYHELEYYKGEYKKHVDSNWFFDDIIGKAPCFTAIKKMAQQAAMTDSTVLLQGETGTGKDVFANAIHNMSARAKNPFISVNCAAIPVELLESELFGYEEGAFSGAGKKGKPGKIELANSGGFFLDEIGDMPMPMQSKLLRVIQNKEIERLGGTRKRRVDVRFIAATNADLEKKMQRNEFRSDLYYRLSVITLTLPPLRDRKSDIPLLIENYLCELNKKYNTEKKITSRAKQMLQEYKWPGNVRELHNIIECAFVFAEDNVIDIINFPNKITISGKISEIIKNGEGKSYTDILRKVENLIISQTLELFGGNISKAAKALSLHRATLHRKLRAVS